MHREGHIGMALLAYAPAGAIAVVIGGSNLAVLGAAAAAALSMAPDVDIRFPLVKHRGITHTVWFATVVGFGLGLVGVVSGLNRGVLASLGLGLLGSYTGFATVVAHIAADALTPMGVRPFAPYDDQKISYGLVNASNPIANYALLCLGGAAMLALLLLESLLQ